MIEIIPLKSENMPRIMEITGKSYYELEAQYLAATNRNEVVMYSVQTWTTKVNLDAAESKEA